MHTTGKKPMQRNDQKFGEADGAPGVSCLVRNRLYCTFCPGYCCYRLPGATLYLDALDINRIARYFGISDGMVRQRYLEGKNTFKVRADGSCIFLSLDRIRARCDIHTARPRQCREFPYGQPCPYLEREDLLAAILPKIERWLAETRLQACTDEAEHGAHQPVRGERDGAQSETIRSRL